MNHANMNLNFNNKKINYQGSKINNSKVGPLSSVHMAKDIYRKGLVNMNGGS